MPPARAKSGRFAKKGEVERRKKFSEHAKELNAIRQAKKKLQDEDRELQSVGTRFIDLAVLANNLWCKTCNASLTLKNMEKEIHRGLASILHVRCVTCLDLVQVPTSKLIRVPNSSYPLWSVNMKAATGCVDSGVGHEQLNTLITSMNIPAVNHHTIKRSEARIGPAIEQHANESIKRALLEEKRLTEDANRATHSRGVRIGS
ncbi:uncharacterized protein LOC117646905 [Thrips palmi]|uniref:Uncharacterized protein LOC117646905 n=1 Tax=Thrips palmi TaxID=161013 RepID=A0A6P8Z279_THRPL|nr:uncharacterized protein LOC117646905 [Thrips palmi]